MNTEQLKTDNQNYGGKNGLLKQEDYSFKTASVVDQICNRFNGLSGDTITLYDAAKFAQDFASQESKIAVEKDRESRWISREDRLPEGKDANRLGEVISLDDKGIPTTIHFNNVIMFDQYSHWQSLPLPPEK